MTAAGKQTITIAIDRTSGLLAARLRELVGGDRTYEIARRRALALFSRGLPLGGEPASRD